MVQTISTKPTSWQRAPQHLEEILKGLRGSPEERLTWPYPQRIRIRMGHESKHNFVYARALDKETNVPLSQDNPDSAISTTAHCHKWFYSGPNIFIFIPSPFRKNGVFLSHISKSYKFEKLNKIAFISIFWDASCNIIFYCFNVVLSMKAGRPIYFYPISSEKIRRDDAETTFPIKSIPIVPYLLPLCARKTTILTILPNLVTTTLPDRNTHSEFYKGFLKENHALEGTKD